MNKAELFKTNLLKSNPEFSIKLEEGYSSGLVRDFGDEEYDIIKSLSDIVIPGDFYSGFISGYNVGRCGFFAKTLSYAYPDSEIVSGYLPILKNSPGSIDGEHGWMETDDKIYDTTLLLVIDKKYASNLGYMEKFRFDKDALAADGIYSSRKERYMKIMSVKSK